MLTTKLGTVTGPNFRGTAGSSESREDIPTLVPNSNSPPGPTPLFSCEELRCPKGSCKEGEV